ncbi:MAG: IlvD/Edd family dehydratase [Propionicimonas sp.]
MALRSANWLGDGGKNGFIARHHLRAMGLGPAQFDGKPVIGIASTWSELTPCNANLRGLADHVRRGVVQAGGVALEFPVMSLSEPLLRPTSMIYRNLAAIQFEEDIRAHPLDAVVLLTGCDKTTPAALMGAASADVPAIVVTSGPMLNGKYRGRDVGSGTDIWKMTEDLRAGVISPAEFTEFESCLNRSAGHCMTMGTASTMSCLAEALGMALPGMAALPAPDSRRAVLAERTGVRAVELALAGGPTPSQVLTGAAFENAVKVLAALGGSTNAVIHLLAIAGRAGVPLDLAAIDRLGAEVPVLVDLMPSGRWLMEEFAYAGGMPALLAELSPLLDTSVTTVYGTLADGCRPAPPGEVIRPLADPVLPAGNGIAVLHGNLVPDGAVIKVSAATAELLTHTGPALVFDSLEEYLAVSDDPALPVTADTVLVVRNLGPRGYPGMPEVGNLPLPAVLLAQGIRDLVRLSDARMSGTAFGTVVLHAAPEASVGGPLALLRTGDQVRLDVPNRALDMLVDADELEARRRAWAPTRTPRTGEDRGWIRLYREHVTGADTGADLDFLVGASPDIVPRQAF